MNQNGEWRCPVCDTRNPKDRTSCWFCGHDEWKWEQLDEEHDNKGYQ